MASSKEINIFSKSINGASTSNSDSTQPSNQDLPESLKTFDIRKYENIEEIYREELAPTSVSLADVKGSNTKVAIKKIYKSCLVNSYMREQAIQECKLHCSLHHRNIVQAIEWGEDEKEYTLVLEFIDRPTYFKDKIETRLTPVKNEDKLKSYIYDILEGLVYLHSKGIVHGDLKLENILLKTSEDEDSCIPTIKLCDFGLTRVLDKETKKSLMEIAVGSASYMAPEIKAGAYVDEKIDIWALGIVLYKMAVAYKPTQISGYKYGSGPIPFRKVDWRKRPGSLQDLIVRMLKMEPSERISAEDALKHEWFLET